MVWINERVNGSFTQRRSDNRNYRHMRNILGIDDERTKTVKDIYLREKEGARQEVGIVLHVHNGMVIKRICEGGNKSGLYGHMKMLIVKGKATHESNVK